ncbi:MAG: helix-turn-helix domain-containing protein [Planctomycetota bacterium]
MVQPSALWRLASHGHEVRGGGETYWLENRLRGARDQENCLLQYTIRGSVSLDWNGQRHRGGPGQAILYRHGEESAYGLGEEDQTPYELLFVHLQGAGLRAHWSELRRRGGTVSVDSGGALLNAMRQLIDRASPQRERDIVRAAALVQHFVLELFVLHERGDPQPRPVERAVQRMVDNPIFPWSLKELAAEAGCSREHLSRAFSRRTGHPPAHWLNQQRLALARQLLLSTDLAVQDIARQAGFSSAATLARQLRGTTGLGPSAWRAAQR